MESAVFFIDDQKREVSIANSPEFRYGTSEVLSCSATDATFGQSWYPDGYQAIKFMEDSEFADLKAGLGRCIQNIITTELGVNVDGFNLENYHRFVRTNADHMKIVGKTRDLFPIDFDFPITRLYAKFEELLGFKLTNVDPHSGTKVHIIVRINRPHSSDYNPPHKDVYEVVDQDKSIPPLLNFWIPISGVTGKSSLPIGPGTHLLPEDRILRTFEGGVAAGNKFRVRMIKEWDGGNSLVRAKVTYGETLVFSSHLIHGLALNEEGDTTRVALEFRLFKQND